MGMARDVILKQEPGPKLDRWVAEEIFGFRVKEGKGAMLKPITKVYGEGAEEPFCPICGNDAVGLWEPNELKPYSQEMIYAMEVAEKTKLFTKYLLRQKTTGRWSVCYYDVHQDKFVDEATGDLPAEAICKAALIYQRARKWELTEGSLS